MARPPADRAAEPAAPLRPPAGRIEEGALDRDQHRNPDRQGGQPDAGGGQMPAFGVDLHDLTGNQRQRQQQDQRAPLERGEVVRGAIHHPMIGEAVPVENVPVRFAGDGAGTGQLPWSQREVWDGMQLKHTWLPIGPGGRLPGSAAVP